VYYYIIRPDLNDYDIYFISKLILYCKVLELNGPYQLSRIIKLKYDLRFIELTGLFLINSN
jgi:hypothetical protein